MSQIVVLVGSVRKDGNTQLLVNSFVNGAKQKNDVEIISMADYEVNPCIGCNACFKREDNTCFQNDDMQIVYKKLSKADIIVVASPVYFYGVSAQLKAVIDRLHSPIRNGFKVRKLGLLLVAGATIPSVFDAIKVQYQLVLDYFSFEDVGKVLVKGVKDVGDIKNHSELIEAYELGKQIK
ncbi:MAG: flavodoxin family protein [Lachnospiraceae bacterium]|nr:flavodoxin family protein [Lachnospiraceae bacterium]